MLEVLKPLFGKVLEGFPKGISWLFFRASSRSPVLARGIPHVSPSRRGWSWQRGGLVGHSIVACLGVLSDVDCLFLLSWAIPEGLCQGCVWGSITYHVSWTFFLFFPRRDGFSILFLDLFFSDVLFADVKTHEKKYIDANQQFSVAQNDFESWKSIFQPPAKSQPSSNRNTASGAAQRSAWLPSSYRDQ